MSIQIHRVTNANIYLNGVNLLGKAKSIELPAIKAIMEQHEALGMVGKIELPTTGIDQLEGSIEFNSFYSEAMLKVANPFKLYQLQARSSLERWASGGKVGEVPLVTFITAGFKENPLGKFEQHKKVELSHPIYATYVKQVLDGRVILEYDAMANLLKVDGQDILEEYRYNVGA